jgi:WD40 repeat protein
MSQPTSRRLTFLVAVLLLIIAAPAAAQVGIRNLCPPVELEPRGGSYTPGGIILTSFDRSALWVYDIDNDRRYPLPETFPCPTNCRLSPDGRTLLYFNDLTNAFNRMRVDGTGRTLVIEYAAQVEFWSADTWLVWTPGRNAYLLRADTSEREPLDVRGIVSVQPGGRWGLLVEPVPNDEGEGFRRALVVLQDRTRQIHLGIDLTYYDDAAWSPDGSRLAFVAPRLNGDNMTPTGSELYLVAPNDLAPVQVTRLTDVYGEARINGLAASALTWSPDGTRVAFWVVDMAGDDPTTDGLGGELHILDVNTRALTKYCRTEIDAHTPNPPRLAWSPDSTHIAYGTDLANDEKPALLLALDTTTGIVTILSEGLYPVLGYPDVTAWGRLDS